MTDTEHPALLCYRALKTGVVVDVLRGKHRKRRGTIVEVLDGPTSDRFATGGARYGVELPDESAMGVGVFDFCRYELRPVSKHRKARERKEAAARIAAFNVKPKTERA